MDIKYGLIVYLETDNIGDDILSYAAMRFLPEINYIIDRENLDIFTPEKKEYVKVIMNGWYLYNKSHWPPSPYIYPLITGIHFSDNQLMGIKDEYLDGMGSDFLKQYQPVGCRDLFTLRKMQARQINAFFSGCLTLTLERFKNAEYHGKYILVDVPNVIQNAVFDKIPKEKVELITHNIDLNDRGKSWDIRVSKVEELIKKYQGAKLVITTRLHCALPCLAIGTPVILIVDENEDTIARLKSYEKYFYYCSTEEFLRETSRWMNYHINSNESLEIRDSIKRSCCEFIENGFPKQPINELPDISLFKKMWSDKTKWQRALNSSEMINCSKKSYAEIQSANQWLKKQVILKDERIKELEDWNHQLEAGKKWLEEHAEEQERYIRILKSNR